MPNDFELLARLSRRSLIYLAAAPFSRALGGPLNAAQGDAVTEEVVLGKGAFELACTSFDCTPPVGFPSETLGENPVIRKIEGPLETRIFAFRQGDLCIGWGNSDFNLYDQTRQRLSAALKIPLSRTIHSITHNHSGIRESGLGPDDKTGFTQKFDANLDRAIASLSSRFAPVNVSCGTGQEPDITYNRKGRRPDGTTYFMREEDRIKLPASYTGVIDPTATVIRFDRTDGNPMLLMTHFTGHPVIAYNLEEPVANPDYSGWAIIDLLQAYRKAHPVGVFLQGCAGDINAKGMFSGPKLARESGEKLGKVFIEASHHTKKVKNQRLGFATGVAHVPYGPLPSIAELEKDRQELLAFQKRVDEGSPDTLNVIGYNFSETMKMGYRRNLATPFLRWIAWAMEMQKAGKPRPLDFLPVTVQVVSFGDTAVAVMPHELFVGIGFSIRRRSPFANTIPVAYSNALYPGYIGTSEDVGSREYMSSYYRYAMKPPYAKPAGDAIADKAVELLQKLWNRANS
jgi:hypothetical protein